MRRACCIGLVASLAACARPAVHSAPPAVDPCDPAALALVPHRDLIEARVAKKRGTMGRAMRNMVATSHALATRVGQDVLASGGNAVDAFAAAVLTEDMVLPGVTSTAGVAGFLVAQPGRPPVYVHGPYRTPTRDGVAWHPGDPVGREVLLPGAPFALLEAQARYGKLPLSRALAPVIALAQDGFEVDSLLAASIARVPSLRRSPYAQATYFRDGAPRAVGAHVRLPVLAATLERLARNGAKELTAGAWAHAFIAEVQAEGGALALADLSELRAVIAPALHARYRGHDVYTASSTSYGGRKLLASLAVLEHASPERLRPIEASADALGLFLRTHRAVEAEAWVRDPAVIGAVLEQKLADRAPRLWDAVANERPTAAPTVEGGSHSSSVIVVDEGGLVVVGTHTIESANWGEGLFVGGFPLGVSTAHMASVDGVLVDPLSATLVYDGLAPWLAMAVYGTGLHPADVQLLSGVVDQHRDVETAVLAPRLGWFEFDLARGTADTGVNLLDPRVPPAVTCQLGALGKTLRQTAEPGYPPGFLDLGFPTMVEITGSGATRTLRGMTPEWMNGVAAGN